MSNKKERLFKRLEEFRLNKVPREAVNPALFLAGLYAGNRIAVFIDNKLSKSNVTGIAGLDGKIAKSLVVGLGGLTLSQLANDEKFKYLGWGLAYIKSSSIYYH